MLGEDRLILAMRPLYAAGPGDLSVLLWPKDIRWAQKIPTACLLTTVALAADYADVVCSPMLVVGDMPEAFACLAQIFSPAFKVHERSVAETAEVHPQAQVGRAIIGPHAIIGPNVVIEDDVAVGPTCVIGAGSVLLAGTKIGQRVKIGQLSVIGSEAFAPLGEEHCQALPSLGGVMIDDDVRVGTHCTVDRGLIGFTHIKARSLLDNQVHVGHDASIGEDVVIAAQSALAGFVVLMNGVTLGGQVGVAPHVRVGEGSRISGKSGVHCDIGAYQAWSGNPCVPHEQYLRGHAWLIKHSKEKSA